MAKIGKDLSEIMDRFNQLTERQKLRMQRQVDESTYLSHLDSSEEFVKRGTESVNRARRSKVDPRKSS
jgi:hypothetical protein